MRGKPLEMAILHSRQTAAGANPHRAIRSFEKATDVVVRQGGEDAAIKKLEAISIESHHARFGSQPNKTIARLDHRGHGVLRQTIFHDPGLAGKCPKSGGGIERSTDGWKIGS